MLLIFHCFFLRCPTLGGVVGNFDLDLLFRLDSLGLFRKRDRMLQDIAILTGGEVISEKLGLKLENASLDQLGCAKRMLKVIEVLAGSNKSWEDAAKQEIANSKKRFATSNQSAQKSSLDYYQLRLERHPHRRVHRIRLGAPRVFAE